MTYDFSNKETLLDIAIIGFMGFFLFWFPINVLYVYLVVKTFNKNNTNRPIVNFTQELITTLQTVMDFSKKTYADYCKKFKDSNTDNKTQPEKDDDSKKWSNLKSEIENADKEGLITTNQKDNLNSMIEENKPYHEIKAQFVIYERSNKTNNSNGSPEVYSKTRPSFMEPEADMVYVTNKDD